MILAKSRDNLSIKTTNGLYDELRPVTFNTKEESTMEKEMVTHSTILAWEIPWTEEPGGLQFMWSQGVAHDLATKKHKTRTNSHLPQDLKRKINRRKRVVQRKKLL